MKEIESVRGYVAVPIYSNPRRKRVIEVGNMGVKVYKRKQDLRDEGFIDEEIFPVVIQLMKYANGKQYHE